MTRLDAPTPPPRFRRAETGPTPEPPAGDGVGRAVECVGGAFCSAPVGPNPASA